MKETIVYCDVCGKNYNVKSYNIVVRKEMDASGNGYETQYEYKDLCFKCLLNYVRRNHEKEIFENSENIS